MVSPKAGQNRNCIRKMTLTLDVLGTNLDLEILSLEKELGVLVEGPH